MMGFGREVIMMKVVVVAMERDLQIREVGDEDEFDQAWGMFGCVGIGLGTRVLGVAAEFDVQRREDVG